MSETYMIPFKGLKEGGYSFEFNIDSEFFERFEESEINEGKLSAIVEVNKRTTHLDLLINISGTVMVSCDRCLEIFSYPINCKNRLIVKFEEDISNDDTDVIYLSVDEYELDLRQHFYEFIYLALPIRRVHLPDENGETGCSPEMIKKLNKLLIAEEKQNSIDPRWGELKKLMNNKN